MVGGSIQCLGRTREYCGDAPRGYQVAEGMSALRRLEPKLTYGELSQGIQDWFDNAVPQDG